MVYLPRFFNLSIPVNKSHPTLPPEVEIRQTVTKGYSLFATSGIPAGTLLFAESPLITIKHDDTDLQLLIQQSLAAVEPHRIRSFYNLHNAHHRWTRSSSRTGGAAAQAHGMTIEAGIWLTNCFLISTSTSAIFDAMSRINHSCIPNVEMEWCEERGLMGVFAKRDLIAGDEVCRSYFEEEVGHRLVDVRREYLKGGWAFECGCKRCVNEAAYWTAKNRVAVVGENGIGVGVGVGVCAGLDGRGRSVKIGA
ncbi:SET domain-containing protein [Choiromyces venosus 120613-1]|uniref:SET domain-containing protein n=1 Tax=Choiromyces venosus 120613-1 TaxID=1336337 RepID=A0A3N4JVT0_9PEZI|nr:SET domain-containing protein [Choiromyces venosus 120613-1]